MKKDRRRIMVLTGILLLLSAGCMKNPDIEYVSNKENVGNLVLSHSANDEGILIAQQIGAPERLSWDCETVNADAEVGIHAEVIVPEVTAIPIWQLQQQEWNSEVMEVYAASLFEAGKIRTQSWDSKEKAMRRIEYLTEFLDAGCLSDGTPLDDVDSYGDSGSIRMSDIIRDEIQLCYDDYSALPTESVYGDSVDYSFINNDEMLGYAGTQLLFPYSYENAGVTGVYNGKEYDMLLDSDGTNSGISFKLGDYERTAYGYDYRCILFGKNATNSEAGRETESTCSFSGEEAVRLCEEFLSQLGIVNMEHEQVEELDLWEVGAEPVIEFNYLGNKGYLVLFHRSYNSIQDISYDLSVDDILEQSQNVHNIAWKQYQKQFPWEEVTAETQAEEGFILKAVPEMAAFIVTDDGITYAWIQNLMQEQECLAENVRLVDFDQVARQAEAHLETLYTDSDKEVSVTFVELNYAAMQSPDKEGEYALIPVWDFRHGEKVYVTINAIDGSTFDRGEGY